MIATYSLGESNALLQPSIQDCVNGLAETSKDVYLLFIPSLISLRSFEQLCGAVFRGL